MPANLTPQYLAAEKAFKEARTIEEKIACLEEMLRVIPKHKGTNHLQGDLRRRLSRLKEQEQHEAAASRKGHSYRISKEGAGQVALAGLPNTGKSALVNRLTNATQEVAPYPFTTRAPQAAMMPWRDVRVQLVDLPPVSLEFEEHWVVDLLKAADSVVAVVDITADPIGQLEFTLAHLRERKLLAGRAGEVPEQEQVPGAVYRPLIVVCNKVDGEVEKEDFEVFRELVDPEQEILPVSAETGYGIEPFRDKLWEMLRVIRVYSKAPGHQPDLAEPFVLPAGSTVLDFARTVHRELAEQFKSARIWSESKYEGQMVHRDEVLSDGDVLELHH